MKESESQAEGSSRDLAQRPEPLTVPEASANADELNLIEGLPLRMDEERGMSLWLDPEYAPNQPNVAITRDLLRRLCRTIQAGNAEAEEAHQLGKSDGYEEAVADIDRLTGGDGEYVYSTLPGEGCPNTEAMKTRIAERFAALKRERNDAIAALSRMCGDA